MNLNWGTTNLDLQLRCVMVDQTWLIRTNFLWVLPRLQRVLQEIGNFRVQSVSFHPEIGFKRLDGLLYEFRIDYALCEYSWTRK